MLLHVWHSYSGKGIEWIIINIETTCTSRAELTEECTGGWTCQLVLNVLNWEVGVAHVCEETFLHQLLVFCVNSTLLSRVLDVKRSHCESWEHLFWDVVSLFAATSSSQTLDRKLHEILPQFWVHHRKNLACMFVPVRMNCMLPFLTSRVGFLHHTHAHCSLPLRRMNS